METAACLSSICSHSCLSVSLTEGKKILLPDRWRCALFAVLQHRTTKYGSVFTAHSLQFGITAQHEPIHGCRISASPLLKMLLEHEITAKAKMNHLLANLWCASFPVSEKLNWRIWWFKFYSPLFWQITWLPGAGKQLLRMFLITRFSPDEGHLLRGNVVKNIFPLPLSAPARPSSVQMEFASLWRVCRVQNVFASAHCRLNYYHSLSNFQKPGFFSFFLLLFF